MNLVTQVLHLIGSGAIAYISARNIRDLETRPNTLAGLQLAESGSVPFLEALRDRATAEGDTWLAEKLARHASDERRHGQIFAHALKQMNKQVIDFTKLTQTRAEKTQDDRRRSPFLAAYFAGYSRQDLKAENIDWQVFLASTYILELDASKDFVRMANALPDTDATSVNLKKGILSVASDETGHAAYLKEALERRMPLADVDALIDAWRSRKVDAMLAVVGSLLQKSDKTPNLVQDGAPVDLATESNLATT